jgi:hypothetical protein
MPLGFEGFRQVSSSSAAGDMAGSSMCGDRWVVIGTVEFAMMIGFFASTEMFLEMYSLLRFRPWRSEIGCCC